MFIKSLLLTRHHGRCWSYSSERVCDLKELKVYMVKTSNKQIKRTYNILGVDKCYKDCKQEIVARGLRYGLDAH